MKTERPWWANRLPVDRGDCMIILAALFSLVIGMLSAACQGLLTATEIYLGVTEVNPSTSFEASFAVIAPVIAWYAVAAFRRVLRLYRVAP